MALRETIEHLATDFIHELLALLMAAPVSELAELERRPLARRPAEPRRPDVPAAPEPALFDSDPADPPPHPEPPRAAHPTPTSPEPPPPDPPRPAPPPPEPSPEAAVPGAAPNDPTPPFRLDGRIVVPAEKRGIPLDDLLLTSRLDHALSRFGYVVLGDLDGRTFAELRKHRGMGVGCERELRHALAPLGVVIRPLPVETPSVPVIDVPAFAREYRLDGLPLRGSRALRRFSVLGDLHGMAVSDLRSLPHVGVVTIRDLQSLLRAMAAAGPPTQSGLLDHLDVALAGLRDDRRRLLLQRFGGGGAAPFSLAELARRNDRSREAVRQAQIHGLARLRALAGPEFGHMLRDLERRISTGEADLTGELARVGRASSPQVEPPPWNRAPFYERLLAALAPGLVRGPRDTSAKRMPGRPDGDAADTSATSVENLDEAHQKVPRASDHEAQTASGREAPEGHAVSDDRGADATAALSGDASPATVCARIEDVDTTDPRGRNKERTRTPEQRAADDAALLASGEPLALLSEIAGMLGVSVKTLRWAVHREGAPLVRYLSSPRPVRYCIADVRAAVEAARPDIEARRKRAEEMEAAERARAEAARAAKAVAPRPPRKKARVPAPARPRAVVAPAPASATRAKQSGPEVLVVRRPGSR